ncbi:hypothetical protein [Propionibacterium freudenreichii]|uniref:hypothetical protein n=1 Tax=Propionibacterium freudenreichii TaxID=1744 RepID=UPI00254B39B5|nr:hypothetical protein [Propionibacterium freudenreichii]MDK9661422.1 hypothetical protein [Propionibacterium freudenreichii]
MTVTQYQDDHPEQLDTADENVGTPVVGLVVDYMTRLLSGAPARNAFRISLKGASLVGEDGYVKTMLKSVTGLDKDSISIACDLVRYDIAYRQGPQYFVPEGVTWPDETTVDHIATMVTRAMTFIGTWGPVTADGFSFPDRVFTPIVSAGDGDLLTEDTLWDLKVSKNKPTPKYTLQLLMYYLMGRKSGRAEFDTITHLGLFNPRPNTVYRIALADVDGATTEEVSRDVIGYR